MPHLNKLIPLSLSAVIAVAVVILAFLPGCSNTADSANAALTEMCKADALLQPFARAGSDFLLDAVGQSAIGSIIGKIDDPLHASVLRACANLAAQNAAASGVPAPVPTPASPSPAAGP